MLKNYNKSLLVVSSLDKYCECKWKIIIKVIIIQRKNRFAVITPLYRSSEWDNSQLRARTFNLYIPHYYSSLLLHLPAIYQSLLSEMFERGR